MSIAIAYCYGSCDENWGESGKRSGNDGSYGSYGSL